MSQETPKEIDVQAAMKAFHERLQETGLKSTRQRDVIVEKFFALDKHISADELLDEVRREQSTIGYATVYRTLKLLVEQDFAVPKNFGDGTTRFDPIHEQEPDHDHLICVDCRRIIEFSDESLLSQIERAAADLGFSLRRKKIEIYAECHTADCPHKP